MLDKKLGHFERGAIILTITSGLSYVLGLLRDRVLAGTFGASDQLDAYQASFVLPDLIFNFFIAGALTAAFIPVFTDLRTKKRIVQSAQLAGTLLVAGISILLVIGIIAWIFADGLTALVAPGFAAEKHMLLTSLTRIMLASPLLFLISNLLGGMLVSAKRFLYYGLSPALYNLGIIIGAAFFAPSIGIHGVAVGTILGAGLHLTVRYTDVRRSGLYLLPRLAITREFKKVIVLMIPRMVGLTATQVQLWAFVAIASTLGEGAVTVYSLARNFQSFPVSLIGIAFATSLFPLLAESASKRARQEYTRRLLRGSLTTLAVVVPAAIVIYILRTPIVSILIGTGQFDASAVARTAMVLGVYTLSIPTESLVHILARGFYALQNTLIPVIISIIAISISISGAFILTQHIGVSGIPAGFAIGTGTQALLLITFLKLWTNRVLRATDT